MDNPFKFGTLVDDPYFTDRTEELKRIDVFLHSENHLILISPRRFGKSSLVRKVVKQSGRPFVWVNMQQVVSRDDFAVKVLKSVFKQFKFEKIKHILRSFRIVPQISMDPMTDDMSVSFQPLVDERVVFEDALNLLEKVSTPEHKLIVVFDEFQDVLEIDKHIDKELRSIMQEQSGLNYILLGSQESMMTDIFERPKSPFYHFGELMRLDKIPHQDMYDYLNDRLLPITKNAADIADSILTFTNNHPYYSQQLASAVWELIAISNSDKDIISKAIVGIVHDHDLDYERLWLTFNKTDQMVIRLISQGDNPVQSRRLPTSTLTSAVKRLMKKGYVLKEEKERYLMEDPFFRQWVIDKNN